MTEKIEKKGKKIVYFFYSKWKNNFRKVFQGKKNILDKFNQEKNTSE